MGSNRVQLNGQITVGDGNGCGDCGSPGTMKAQGMALRCSSFFEAIVSGDAPIQVLTAGAIGNAWMDVPTTEALEKVEMLLVRGNAPMRIRVGAGPAVLAGVGASYPHTFTGGETLSVELDDVPLAVTFGAGALTAQQVANAVNAAAALAGFSYFPASVSSGGQLQLSGRETGIDGSVDIVSGSALAALGLAALQRATGSGSDTDFYGLYLVEFGRGLVTAPERIQVSGNGLIEVFAAGTPA